MIVVIGGVKGGTGKTTLASNLVVMRSNDKKKVLLVDADEQKSLSDWALQRDHLKIPTHWSTIQLSGEALASQINRMKSDYSDIIIDVGGRDTRSQRSALSIADLYIIPFKPRSFDIWTLGIVKELVTNAKIFNPKLKCIAVINQGDSRGSDNEDSMSIIKECKEITCFESSIGYRKAFANAATDGLAITEMPNSDVKAISEIHNLYSFIYG